MLRSTRMGVAVVVMLACVAPGFAQKESALAAKFLKRSYTSKTTLPYRLFVPANYDASRNYPLILALHGAGERGDDNMAQLRMHGMATVWADSSVQAKNPCFIVAPQCPYGRQWVNTDWTRGSYSIDKVPISAELATVNDLVDSLSREFPINTDRIYLTGLSMGGYGTWDLLVRFPNRFAAAIPMSGAADTSRAASIRHLPIWNFHGGSDRVVPVSGSRDIIAALLRANRACVFTEFDYRSSSGEKMSDSLLTEKVAYNAPLIYSEYIGKDHAIWAESYANPLLARWLFAQSRATAGNDAQHEQIEMVEVAYNYPNPFNPSTTIEYTLKQSTMVAIDILNLAGQKIIQLLQARQDAGRHFINFNAKDLPSGNYFFRIRTPEWVQHGNMILLR